MTREDIIRMAQEAGIGWGEKLGGMPDFLERFAALVASAERERIKQANAPEIERINAHIKELEDAVIAEREACAQMLEAASKTGKIISCTSAAKAIRARKQA